jgi:DNA-directed RNA polymerase subunit RPC12/RpoP
MYVFKMKIGNNVIEVHEDSFSSICKNVALLSYIPKKCDKCGSENLYPHYNKANDGTEYFKIRCSDCSAELRFHQRKAGGYYIDTKEKMEVYVPKTDGEKQSKNEEDVF